MSDTTTAVGGKVKEIVPYLVVRGASEAIEYYTRAFGAKETYRMASPDGEKLWHAEVAIGDSKIFLVDEFPERGSLSPLGLGNSPVTVHLEVDDADAIFGQAVATGATVVMPLADMFWGDRFGKVVDPFGHHWSISQKIEDVTPEMMRERMAAMAPSEECAGQAVAV